jgi:hypothetical protein
MRSGRRTRDQSRKAKEARNIPRNLRITKSKAAVRKGIGFSIAVTASDLGKVGRLFYVARWCDDRTTSDCVTLSFIGSGAIP